jgi:hypothetical protein
METTKEQLDRALAKERQASSGVLCEDCWVLAFGSLPSSKLRDGDEKPCMRCGRMTRSNLKARKQK